MSWPQEGCGRNRLAEYTLSLGDTGATFDALHSRTEKQRFGWKRNDLADAIRLQIRKNGFGICTDQKYGFNIPDCRKLIIHELDVLAAAVHHSQNMRQKALQELKQKRRLKKKLARVQQRITGRGSTSMGMRDANSKREKHLSELLALPSSQAILSFLEDEFEKNLFFSALRNLTDTGNPIRFNNFAYAMREVTLMFLRKTAPAADIERCSWYTNVSGEEAKVTRGERVRYAIQGGLSNEKVAELLLLDEDENRVEEVISQFLKLYQKGLNEHTHIKERTFDIGNERTDELADEVLGSVREIQKLIGVCQHEVNQHVSDKVDDAVLSEFLRTVFANLDLLSTHTTIAGVGVDEHKVEKIYADRVQIHGSGTVYVNLQYGSGSDMRNGNGAINQNNFPFEFTCTANIADLNKVQVNEQDIEVDTSSFYK